MKEATQILLLLAYPLSGMTASEAVEESFWVYSKQTQEEWKQATAHWISRSTVSVNQSAGTCASGWYSVAQSFAPNSETIDAIELCVYPVGGTAWVRLDLAADADGRPGQAIARSWVRLEDECPVAHSGFMTFPFRGTKVTPGATYWFALTVFSNKASLEKGRNGTNIGFSDQASYDNGHMLKNRAQISGEERLRCDLRFRIIAKAAQVVFLRKAEEKELRDLPEFRHRNTPWLTALDDWTEFVAPSREYPRLDDRAPLDVLIASLHSEDLNTRQRAVDFIASRGEAAEAAVPALLEQLESHNMVESALHALVQIGPAAQGAIPALFQSFTKYPENPAARWSAAQALARIGGAAVPTLTKGTHSENRYEELWSHAALAKLEGPESQHFQFLMDTLISDDERRGDLAARCLAMIGPVRSRIQDLLAALDNPVIAARNDTKTEIICLLGRMERDGVPAIPKLVSLLDDTGWLVNLRAAQALQAIGGPEAKGAAPALVRMLSDKDDALREAASDTLAAIGPAAVTAVPHLITRLHSDLSFRGRAKAARALTRIAPDDLEVRKELIRAMKHPDESLRGSITHMVASCCPPSREWIDIFLSLHESTQHSLRPLEVLYFRVKPEERSVFPKEIRERRAW